MTFRNLPAPPLRSSTSGHLATTFIEVPAAAEQLPAFDATRSSVWKIVRRYRLLLAASAIVCAVVAFAVSTAQAPSFVATVAVEIQDFNDNVLNTSDLDTVARNSNSDAYLETEVEALTTTSLLQRVADKLHLETAFQKARGESAFDGVRRFLGMPRERLTPRERAVQMIRDGMQVNTPKGASRIVRISFAADDPKLAARVANSIAEEFIDQNMQLRMQATRRTSTWLAQQIDDLRSRLQVSEQALQKFGDSAGLVFTSDKDNIAEAKLKQLQDELSKAQAERIEKQSRHETVARGGTEVLEPLDSGPLRDYQIKLSDTRQRLAELESTFTPNHPKVMQARAEVAAIEASIDSERRNILRRITSDFDSAQRREQLLASAFNMQTRLVTAQEAQAARYMLLKNEVDTNRQMYDAMLQKVKSLNIASAMQARNIIVIDPAEPPTMPSAPRPLTNSGVGMITGLLMAAVFAIARERANQSIRTPGLTQTMLRVPELGVIPNFREQNGLVRRAMSVVPGRPQPALEFVTLRQGDSPIADSYRAVVASLLFGKENSDGGRVFGITSALPSEGKTTALCNLAIVLTRINRSVLVIDADFRKPRLSAVFGVSNEQGLTDFLRSETPVGEYVLSELSVESTIPRVSVMPVGSGGAGDVDLLHSPRLGEIIGRVRREFDFVLIDTPPVIPVPDARIIGQEVDGVLLICRASITSAEVLLSASRRFQEDGTRVVGTILNDFDPAYAGNYYNASTYYSRTSMK